jgi:aspartyl/glutamyl-tRNA(Asn/Gln) amidotransferase C subunit
MISKEEVLNLAALARLKVSEQEVESLEKDISSILEYVGQIGAVPGGEQGSTLDQGSSRSNLAQPYNVLREDVVRGEDDPMAGKEESIRKEFPRREGDYLQVQKILQKDE